jgi:hypothetical protein
MAPEEIKRALIVVRTYPTPSAKGVEVSCTAAITDDGNWLRLFPVPWRLLPRHQQFRKYQWVDLRVTKAEDQRPESYKLKQDGIAIRGEPMGTANGWAERKAEIFPLRSSGLCSLIARRNAAGYPTLGIFRPKKIHRLIIRPESENWSQAQIEALKQRDLFLEPPKVELQKIPYKFSYEFNCEDESCTRHTLMCADWEMGESCRRWKREYGSQWEEKFRQRYENEMIHKNDTHFYVGTVHRHPHVWIIVGLFYPPRSSGNLGLFD